MRIYMAGGVSGNLKPMWSRAAGILEGAGSFEAAADESLREFLSEDVSCKPTHSDEVQRGGGAFETLMTGGGFPDQALHPYILESFYYVDEDTEKLLPYFGDFMLDSGAFTFMQGKEGETDWVEYIERYADFISRNNIEKFFELDIDSVVGYEKVLEYRKLLERLTQKQCIPVWHISRGAGEFSRMVREYPYAAVGGIVSKEITRDRYPLFGRLISEAHKSRCKLHGLGFTNLADLNRYHFDSVDSTSWTSGNRFGHLWKFNGTTMVKRDIPKGHRITKPRAVALNNFVEWTKFQQYAERKL